MRIEDKNVLITGGATGIGLALAKQLIRRKNAVAICALNSSDIEQARQQAPELTGYVCDITEPEDVDRMLQALESDGFAVDVLINNAGIISTLDLINNPLEATERIRRDIEVCVMGMVDLTHKLLPSLYQQGKGMVVNVCSPAGLIPVAQTPGYSLAKAAVHSYTQSLRYQVAEKNIHVVEVFPPSVATQIAKHSGRKSMSPEQFATQALAKIDKGKEEVWLGESYVVRLFAKLPRVFGFNVINKAVPIVREDA